MGILYVYLSGNMKYRPAGRVSTKIGGHEYFLGKKNGKYREYRYFSETCLVSL